MLSSVSWYFFISFSITFEPTIRHISTCMPIENVGEMPFHKEIPPADCCVTCSFRRSSTVRWHHLELVDPAIRFFVLISYAQFIYILHRPHQPYMSLHLWHYITSLPKKTPSSAFYYFVASWDKNRLQSASWLMFWTLTLWHFQQQQTGVECCCDNCRKVIDRS